MIDLRFLPRRCGWLAFDNDWQGVVPATQRQIVTDTDRLDAGQATDPLQRLVVEADALMIFFVLVRRQLHTQRQNTIGIKAKVDLTELPEALNQQSGGDHQSKRQRHLRDDQEITNAPAGKTTGRSSDA